MLILIMIVEIQHCVLQGHISEALQLVRIAYPGLLDTNKALLFKLKCRQFVEMIGGYDQIVVDGLRLSCSSELGEGIPPPATHNLTTPAPCDLPMSPHVNESSGGVLDNGVVS